MQKVALITGVTGQDGSYLAELLLGKGYIVHGIKRRSSSFNTERVDPIYQDPHVNNRHFILHYGDLSDATNLIRLVQEIQPDEIYNLGAQIGDNASLMGSSVYGLQAQLGANDVLKGSNVYGLQTVNMDNSSNVNSVVANLLLL